MAAALLHGHVVTCASAMPAKFLQDLPEGAGLLVALVLALEVLVDRVLFVIHPSPLLAGGHHVQAEAIPQACMEEGALAA